ncbi:MAG TPA: uroporphyrinogen-III C-methyltransferase [Steroidobacteraceae bacterium]|jgi:uroporphyrin-3 C-methyltransferase|nr:uroporphyrinogen-III C-methyltransferase [Steroidobacteraceae bacterium]
MDQQPGSPSDAPVPSTDSGGRFVERRHEDRRKLERVSVRGLMAVLLASVAIAMAALAIWQATRASRTLNQIHVQQSQLIADNAQLRSELESQSRRLDANMTRLEELGNLAPRVSELADNVDQLRERTESAERSWANAEARYLLDVANRRLTLERDWVSALAALEAADERLQSLKDPSLNPIRRTLASEIQDLRNISQPDIPGIVSRLASAEETAAFLPVLGAIQENYSPDQPVAGSPPGLARAWQVIRASLVGMVSVRRIGEDAVELVSIEQQSVRREHLQLLLFASRLSALRGDQNGYQTNLDAARLWLEKMFDPTDARVMSLRQELAVLEKMPITPTLPDISKSLHQLQAHDERRGP